MTTTFVIVIAAAVQLVNLFVIFWLVRKQTVLQLHHMSHHHNMNVVDNSGAYMVARALIKQHLIDAWDKQMWEKELEALENSRLAGMKVEICKCESEAPENSEGSATQEPAESHEENC